MAVQRSYKYYKTYLQQQQPQQHVTTNKINNNNINDNDEIDAIFPPRKFIISGPSGVGKTYYIEKIICKECKFYRTIKIHGSDLFKFTDIGDGETYMLDAFTSSINSDNNINKITNNKLNIYLPEMFLEDKDVTREIDYIFRLLGVLNKKLRIVEVNNQKFYFPNDYINISETKQKSLRNKFAEISALIS